MGVVTRLGSGYLFEDSFAGDTLDSAWEIVPNDTTRWSLPGAEGGLRMKHGEAPLFGFLSMLTDESEFVLDVKNRYHPTAEGYSGGIIVYGNEQDFIPLEEYFDAAKGMERTYPWLRLVRHYNTYSAYWSEDGDTWTFIANADFDHVAPKIGLFVQGNTNGWMDIEYVRAMRGSSVRVKNLSPGTLVELVHPSGEVMDRRRCRSTDSQVSFPLLQGSLPLTGAFRVTLPNGSHFYVEEALNLYGGDRFRFEVTPDLYFEDSSSGTSVEVRAEKGMEQFLGYLTAGESSSLMAMSLKNPFSATFQAIELELVAYQTNQFQRMVRLALDQDGVPGSFSDRLHISQLPPRGSISFWAELSRETDPAKFASDVRFGMNLSSQGVE